MIDEVDCFDKYMNELKQGDEMILKDTHNIKSEAIADATGVTRKMLLPRSETPNFEMRCFTIQPGGEMPRHTNEVEHEQFVISGRARIGIADDEFDVQYGSIILIPANVPHWYKNTGTEVFQFLCLVPNQDDTLTYI
jgi:quercetin dioxygenase-like cupin family protein